MSGNKMLRNYFENLHLTILPNNQNDVQFDKLQLIFPTNILTSVL